MLPREGAPEPGTSGHEVGAAPSAPDGGRTGA